MSDTSRTQLIYRPETVFAETAPANAATQKARYTRSALVHKNITVISEEIRSDRQRSDLALVSYEASGEVGFEAIYGSKPFEDFLQAALCGSWGTPTTDNVRNGVTDRSFGIEQGFLDIGKYIYYAGCVVDRWALDVSAQRIVQLGVTFSGVQGIAAATTVGGITVPTADATADVMRAGPKIKLLTSGGSGTEFSTASVRSLKLEINPSLRRRDLVTQYQTDDFGRGVQEITGTLETYFKDIIFYNQFVANGIFGLAFELLDPVLATLNAYKFSLPKLKITDAPVPIPGIDADTVQTFAFRALLDPGVGYTINVQRNLTVP